MSRNIAYLRISTAHLDQKTDRQLNVGIDFDKTFEDKASGKSINNRPAFIEMLEYVQENDTIHIQSNDRCFRNVKEMLNFIECMLDRKINIRLHTENLHFIHDGNEMMLAQNKLMLTNLAAFSEFFLTQNRVAIKQGLAVAKEKGNLKKTKGTKWHETYTANRAAGKHSTTKLFKPSPQKDKLIVDIKTAISYGSPKSFVELAEKLNKNKVFTLGNKPWNGRTLSTFCQRNEIKL
ncbi:hypothetical protein [Vibrio phage vB_VibM_10AMN]|uniref:Resolvase/invertase-type recombinase catalytic domain-containing protein n=1 Tax=Staphylococcus phage vB_VibM_10AMN12 TaxID=3076785 RepID=A0AA96KSM7_9CAUD|nr:hypothetical protein [Vibrio phage vB_VibM_10AMN]WNO47420.1 hypothetical protein [Staphylococcus phage vB_VibM_10AMN12]